MSEKWLIVGPNSPLGDHSVGTGFDRTVVLSDCPEGRAFIVDPDVIHTTNLITGESKTFRQQVDG